MVHEKLRHTDPKIGEAIECESGYVENNIVLIASENYASQSVLKAQGSLLTNKHAGGYPGNRTLPGGECVDEIERLAINRAKQLWDADHVNVQPYSGSMANMIVFLAMLDPGDRILALEYTDGGHRTHGHPSHATGPLYTVDHYRLDATTGYIDYDHLAEKAATFNPHIIVSGFSAYPRDINWERIQAIANKEDSYHLADIAHPIGLTATGHHSSPVNIADFVTGSTDKTLRAGRGGIVMCSQEHTENIDSTTYPGLQGGPIMHNIAGKAVGFHEALQDNFSDYNERIIANAKTMAETLAMNDFELVTGGTDTHLLVADLTKSHRNLTGQRAQQALQKAGIIVNSQYVPGDSLPDEPQGLRIGTPAITTRGFGPSEAEQVAMNIVRVLKNPDDDDVIDTVRTETTELCQRYPVYQDV